MPNQARSAAEDKRALIIDAALQVFAEHGVHGTAVPPIAKQAGVAVGTLYRYFDSKEALVNAVFRDTKDLLGDRLMAGLDTGIEPEPLFLELWDRLANFAREEPAAFQFLEMQDHTRYLDEASRTTELGLLAPLAHLIVRGQEAGTFNRALRPEVAIALVWGSVVGLFKARRHGYLRLTDEDLNQARAACLRTIANPAKETSHEA